MIRFSYILVIIFTFSFSQWTYNHPELDWQTIESEHFLVHFHKGTENSAREASFIAEYIYPYVTNLYDFEPDSKVEIIIKDVDDYSNGSAYYYDNMIEIWAKPLDYDLRGSHRWMQDVITHEFTHIVQLGKSMKFPRFIPGAYIQLLGYEQEKRDDVIYGYPNQILSYTFPGTAVPPWFAEGTAQYMYDIAYFDYCDSIRDMLLRDLVLNNNILSFDQMNTFGKCGLGNELVYNHGFSLVNYIVDNYGENSLLEISNSLSKPFNYSINKAIFNTLGISGYDLYDNWKSELQDKYNKQYESIIDITNNEYKQNYTIIESTGTTNLNPVWSPDSQNIAFISNMENDFFSQTDLFIYNTSDSTSKKIQASVKSKPTWITDSILIYTKRSKPDANGSKYFDLYSYSLQNEEEERLTEGLRLFSPFYDKEKDKLLAINTYDGTNNVLIGNKDFSEYKQLTNLDNGTQIFSISGSGKEDYYLIDAVLNDKRDLYLIDVNSGGITPYLLDEFEKRDPYFFDGELYYSADKNGIFNLYKSNNVVVLGITNLVGGAFKPHVSNQGHIVFSIYENGKFNIAILDSDNEVAINEDDIFLNEKPKSELVNSKNDSKAYPYNSNMTGPFFLPRIMQDYNRTKLGLYFYDTESLRNLSVLGGFSLNSINDLDFSLMFDYNKNYWSNYINLYWATRHISKIHYYERANGLILDNLSYDVDYTYHLFTTDIGSRFMFKDHKFALFYTFSNYRQFYDIVQSQDLPEEYQNDFMNEYDSDFIIFDDAYDYFRGHSINLNYLLDATKKHYLSNMIPHGGFKLDLTISYESNNLFDEYQVNEDYGGFIPYLKEYRTKRYIADITKYWKIIELDNDNVSLESNLRYYDLSNHKVDDFLYFFGGGLTGIMGYTFYEPILQGTNLYIISNKVRVPLFTQQAYGFSSFYISSISIGVSHQFGKSDNGKILVNNVGYDISVIPEYLWDEEIENYLQIENSIDALDGLDVINDNLESYLYPDIYSEYDDNDFVTEGLSITDIKNRYRAIKESMGIELRILGFSFYSYPTALSYEYHIPLHDPINSKGRQYIKLLFDF